MANMITLHGRLEGAIDAGRRDPSKSIPLDRCEPIKLSGESMASSATARRCPIRTYTREERFDGQLMDSPAPVT